MNAHEETLGILEDTCFEPYNNVLPENTMGYIMVKGRVENIFALGVKSAQQSVQRIAFGAGAAGVLVGVIASLIVVFFLIGVR